MDVHIMVCKIIYHLWVIGFVTSFFVLYNAGFFLMHCMVAMSVGTLCFWCQSRPRIIDVHTTVHKIPGHFVRDRICLYLFLLMYCITTIPVDISCSLYYIKSWPCIQYVRYHIILQGIGFASNVCLMQLLVLMHHILHYSNVSWYHTPHSWYQSKCP